MDSIDFKEKENITIEDLIPAAERVVKYIKENGFEVVVANGSSAQTAAYMVKDAWRRMYPATPIPKFVSLGLTGSTKELVNGHLINVITTKQTHAEPPHRIEERLRAGLKGTKSPKIVLLDETVVQGTRLSRIKFILEEMGYRGIKTCALYKNVKHESRIRLDFVASKGTTSFPEVFATRRILMNSLLKDRASAKIAKVLGEKFTASESRRAKLDKLKSLRTRSRLK
jgi:hypothetical protein